MQAGKCLVLRRYSNREITESGPNTIQTLSVSFQNLFLSLIVVFFCLVFVLICDHQDVHRLIHLFSTTKAEVFIMVNCSSWESHQCLEQGASSQDSPCGVGIGIQQLVNNAFLISFVFSLYSSLFGGNALFLYLALN